MYSNSPYDIATFQCKLPVTAMCVLSLLDQCEDVAKCIVNLLQQVIITWTGSALCVYEVQYSVFEDGVSGVSPF